MTRTTDQFVGLNSTMVSLRDAIIALGVAQDDIARIEEERAAAEQAERDRVSNERTASQYTAAASGHMAQSVDAIGRAQQGVDAIGLGGQEIGEISKLIERYAGDDGLLQSSEYGALRDTVESMDPGHYRALRVRSHSLRGTHHKLHSMSVMRQTWVYPVMIVLMHRASIIGICGNRTFALPKAACLQTQWLMNLPRLQWG